MAIASSALFLAGREFEPEKITSSMDAARMDLCEDSPMTQRNASTRFDFPQPFGPTTPVNPGSIRKSVGSTKDLKPSRRSRVSFMWRVFQGHEVVDRLVSVVLGVDSSTRPRDASQIARRPHGTAERGESNLDSRPAGGS